jgi:cysteine-rich repeat protein
MIALHTLTVTGGQPLAIFVDGFNKPADAGPFTLDVIFQPSVCGDDMVSPFEQCDDGNPTQTDGCDNGCHIVPQGEVEPNDAAGAATPASEGVISGTIDVMANVDWYAVTVPGPASSLSVNIGDGATSTCAPTGEIESEIEVYDSAMVSIGYNDDISSNITGNFCSALYLTGLADGTYYVRVAASQEYCDDCLFDYSLTVSVE